MRTRALLLLTVLLLVMSPVVAEEYAINTYPPTSSVVVFVLWVLVFFLVLVYCDEIRRATLARVWTLATSGQVLFLVGLTIVQASYLSIPISAYEPWVALNPVPTAVRLLFIFSVVISGFLFLVEWSRIFSLSPRIMTTRNLGFLPIAVVLASLAFAFPFLDLPNVGLEPRTMTFPIIACAAFLALNAYFTLTGYFLLTRVRVLSRFKWMVGYSVLLTCLMLVMVGEYVATPEEMRVAVYAPILFPLFTGILILLIGYVLHLQAMQLFVKALLPQSTEQEVSEVEGELALKVVTFLAGRFISEAPIEGMLIRAVRDEPALASLKYERDKRRLKTKDLDTSSEQVLVGLTDLYTTLFDSIIRFHPPVVDEDYTEDSLKARILKRFSDQIEELPPPITGHLLPRSHVLKTAFQDTMDALLSALPLEAGFSTAVANKAHEAWDGDFFEHVDSGLAFDADAFFKELEEKELDEEELVDTAIQKYLKAHRVMFEPVTRFIDHKHLNALLEDHVRKVVEKPLYRAADVSDILLNAYFARDHGWGFQELEAEIGRLHTGYLTLLAADPGFPKERFCAAFLAENLEHYRNALWVTQAKHAVLTEFISAYLPAEALLKENALKLMRIDATIEGVTDVGTNVYRVGDRFADLEWSVKKALESFPPSGVCTVLSLPVPLLQNDPLALYRFASALKSLSETYNVTFILEVNNELCDDRSFAVLSDLSEVVIEAKRNGRIKAQLVGTTKESYASLTL